MLEINANLHIPDDELHWTFVRSGGPGGQNVNKVASKAVLRWNAAGNTSLPVHVKARLVAVEKTRLTAEGDLLFTSQRFREQERNRQDCLEKLRALILRAARPPRPRKATRPTRGSRKARLQAKRQRSALKKARSPEISRDFD